MCIRDSVKIFNSDSESATETSPLESQSILIIGEETVCLANSLTGFQESFFIEVLRSMITDWCSSTDATSKCLNKCKCLEPPEGFEPSAC